ncbi:MAG: radical SAM protein [Pedococcus sp.]
MPDGDVQTTQAHAVVGHGATRGETAYERLTAAIHDSDLPNYVYSYPSKRAYRHLDPPVTIAQAWAGHHGPVNLYLHIPFCGYRCSFCTLFLTTNPPPDLVDRYVASLRRQLAVYGELLDGSEVVSVYVGGGTPTTLTPAQFSDLVAGIHEAFPRRSPDLEFAVEGSPDTMERTLLTTMRDLGVNRISMGVQTLDPEEARRAGRRYPIEQVHEAAALIDDVGFDNVNYDLIYGLEGQTPDSWRRSLEGTLALGPDTVTLYPIVFRPLTVIGRHHERSTREFLDNTAKYALYNEAVDTLSGLGFRQNTFVRFSRRPGDGLLQEVSDFAGTPLLGLGAGARSYSPILHYSTDFAVRSPSTAEIISGFVDHEHTPDQAPSIGFVMDADETRRRLCILNLSLGRLDRTAYEQASGGCLEDWREELDALVAAECATREADGSLVLTRLGFEFSNVIATLFQSPAVDALEGAYVAV